MSFISPISQLAAGQPSFLEAHPDALSAILKAVSDLGAQNLLCASRSLRFDVMRNERIIKRSELNQFLTRLTALLQVELSNLQEQPATDDSRFQLRATSRTITSLIQLRSGLSFNDAEDLNELKAAIEMLEESAITFLSNLTPASINTLSQIPLPSFFEKLFIITEISTKIRPARNNDHELRIIVREFTDINEFDRAQAVISLIQDPQFKSYALSDVVNGFIASNEFNLAIAAALTIPDIMVRFTTLNRSADALRQAGNYTLANLVPSMVSDALEEEL
jgi:hypothetical protein